MPRTAGKTLLAVLLLMSALQPAAEEVPVRIGADSAGRLLLPEAEPAAAVLLLHGWNGSMDEVGGLYADLARALADLGIASLRFDFSGEGERAGFVVTSTFESRVAEAEAAYALLRERVPGLPLGVQGFSLGGLTAMTIASAHPDWFRTMVLWSAASRIDLARDPAMAASVRAALRDGRAELETWTRITLTREFLVSYVGVDAAAGLGAYPGSLLAIRGSRDYLPRLDPEWLEATPGQQDAFLLIDGADHIFSVLAAPRPDYGRRVIDSTSRWFAERLRE